MYLGRVLLQLAVTYRCLFGWLRAVRAGSVHVFVSCWSLLINEDCKLQDGLFIILDHLTFECPSDGSLNS